MRGSWSLRLLIPAVIVAALVIDATLGTPTASLSNPVVAEIANKVEVQAEETLTSTWFCPVIHMREVDRPAAVQTSTPTDTTQDEAAENEDEALPVEEVAEFVPLEINTEILITNITDRTVRALLELNSTRDSESVPLVVGPREVKSIIAADIEIEPGELMSAVVEVAGGGVAVTRRLVSQWGVDEARCSSTLSAQWEIPMGDTQADARDLVVIQNPLPRYAVVDVSLASDAEPGAFNLPELQGLVIPGRSTKVIDVANYARRRTVASATVFVRTGRVTVDHLSAYDGSVGRAGFSAELAIPATSDVWWVPLPGIDDLSHVVIRVLNPSDELAEVEISARSGGVRDDTGDVDDDAGVNAEPFEDSVSVVVLGNDVTEVRLAAGTTAEPDSHTLLVNAGEPVAVNIRSLNGEQIAVASEMLIGDPAAPAAPGDLTTEGSLVDPDQEGTEGSLVDPDQESTEGSLVDPDQEGTPESESLTAEEELAAEIAQGLLEEQNETAIEPIPPLFDAVAGLASVPAHVAPKTRWLLVIPPGVGTDAYVTLMVVPSAELANEEEPQGSDNQQGETVDPSQASLETVVVQRRLDGEQIAMISVPASGVVTQQLTSDLVHLLESDTPFVPIVYSFTPLAHGLSGIVALPY